MSANSNSAASSNSLYKPKNILLTGGAGFIGSHVVIEICQQYPDYHLFVLDKLDYCGTLNNLQSVKGQFTFIKGDILSVDLVNYVLSAHSIDTIMHFAALSHVDNSFGSSMSFTKANVMGTHVLLEAARHSGMIKRFIHVSTDEVYGETDERMGEDMVLEPTNPYAASKAAAEFLVKSYYRSFKLPIIITRGNNVYGPHQYPEKLIPKFICRLARGQACCLHGDGSNTRSFLYVTDVARAFALLLHHGKVGQVYNIGTKFEVSNLQVAKTLIAMFGIQQEDKFLEYVPDRKFNDKRYLIDVSKMKELGWEPQISWEEGLKRTIEWYQQDNLANYWADDFTLTALKPHPTLTPQFK